MEHLSEERLIAHHYGDEDARSRAQAEQHLAACPACAAQLTEISALLGVVVAPEPPARDDAYGTEVWNRIRAHLPEQPEGRSWFGWPQRWAAAAAVAALIVAAFLVGRYAQPPSNQPVAQQSSGQIRERVLLVALGDHLDRSQMVLVEIANAPTNGGPVDISAEQQRAEDLVDASRLYRQTAQSVGDNATAKVLDELERTLLDIAHSPSQLDQADLKRIQERIESQGLIFKVRVIGAKVKQEQRPHHPGMKDESDPQSQSRKQI
jgi:anti-sigma factor RsiW